jgi:ubiquinone/menaquinone biosynthesis C-methylase UbiE
MKKQQISNLLRKLGLLYFFDYIWFYVQKIKNHAINKKFKILNPNIPLPPDYLIFESFQLNYSEYYTESIDSAKSLLKKISKHKEINNVNILDWGCGPGRIIRHIPELTNFECNYYATDYNEKSIQWCRANLKNIEFNHNSLEAKLPYKDDNFDIIYGLSIITHLSEAMHYEWYNELYRVLKRGGIMLLTSQGDNFRTKLTPQELELYEQGKLVVRGKVKEGHRTYSAFHPKAFMLKLFENAEILEHLENKIAQGNWMPQDYWIIKK